MKGAHVDKMHQSFSGPFDAPGDTQPDSQFYRDYTSNLTSHMQFITTNGDGRAPEEATDTSIERPGDNCETPPLDEDEEPTSPTIFHTEEEAIGMEEPETQLGAEPTSPMKFETPAMFRNRDNQDQTASSALRTSMTPGTTLTTAFFGAGGLPDAGPSMSLTQLFNATQVRTSPVVNVPPSDHVFQRPSPNFTQVRPSSPPRSPSSPSKATYPNNRNIPNSVEEMDENEEDMDHYSQDSFDEPREAEKMTARRRTKENAGKEAQELYSSATAPSRDSAHSSRSRRTYLLSSSPKFKTPAALRRSRHMASLGTPGKDHDTDNDSSEVETTPPIDFDLPPSNDDSDPVISSLRSKATGTKPNQQKPPKVLVPNTSSHPERIHSGQDSRDRVPPSSPSKRLAKDSQASQGRGSQAHWKPPRRFKRTDTELVTIADSQPDVTAGNISGSHPQRIEIPSTPSTNQYSISQTAHNTIIVTSQVMSSIPMPPAPSSPDIAHDADAIVPSSPPIENGVLFIPEGDHDLANGKAGDEVAEAMDLVNDHNIPGDDEDEQLPDTQEHDPGPGRQSPTKEVPNVVVPHLPTTTPERGTIPESNDVHRSDAKREKSPVPNSQPDMNVSRPETNNTEPLRTSPSQKFTAINSAVASHTLNLRGGVESGGTHETRLSLTGIANAPETQHSVDARNFEIPDLGLDEHEEMDAILLDTRTSSVAGSSPVSHYSKKRRVVYGKNRAYVGSPKTMGKTPRKPPPSPLKQVQSTVAETPATAEKHGEPVTSPTVNDQETGLFTTPATLRRGILARPSRTLVSSKNKLRPVSPALLNRMKRTVSNISEIAETPARPGHDVIQDSEDVEMTDAPEGPVETVAQPATPTSNAERADEAAGALGEPPSGERLNPNRVFARWPSDGFYYPATCIGASHGRYSVCFDDEDRSTVSLDTSQVRLLDLSLGEQVKVAIKGMKQTVYFVVGFKDKIARAPAKDEYPSTDSWGYAKVVLLAKKRDSMPAKAQAEATEPVSVDIADIYLTTSLWNKMESRGFTLSTLDSTSGLSDNLQHATTSPAADSTLLTPAPRASVTHSVRKSPANRSADARNGSPASGLFANMMFAVSSIGAKEPSTITDLIIKNGGQVLSDGFSELFDIPTSDSNDSSPLVVKSEYSNLGFVALITEAVSRKPKYMEALALNVPCLHYRWLMDCVRKNAVQDPWKYLLPAGYSSFLDAAAPVLRSRTLPHYDISTPGRPFPTVFEERVKLFQNQGVLLIIGKGKTAMKNPFVFLIQALGPKQVGFCTDASEAKKMLGSGGEWDWVYAVREAGGFKEAEGVVFGNGSETGKPGKGRKSAGGGAGTGNQRGRKRKREESVETAQGDSSVPAVEVRSGVLGERVMRVASDEFILQSIILGALWEE